MSQEHGNFVDVKKSTTTLKMLIEPELRSTKKNKPETEQNKIEENINGTLISSEDETENYTLAPKIKINEKGEIVIDEESLVVQDHSLNNRRRELQESVAINSNTESNGFYTRGQPQKKRWSKQETILFYKSLNTLGSDFHAMTEIFPTRSRRQLKKKFNSDDKINPVLIDKVMTATPVMTIADLKKESEGIKNSMEVLEKRKIMQKELKTRLKKQIPYLSEAVSRPSRTKRPHHLEVKNSRRVKLCLDI